MLTSLKRFNHFVPLPKARLAMIILLNVGEAFFAISGLALLYPLIRFLQVGREVFLEEITSGKLKYLGQVSDWTGIEVSLGFLVICAVLPVLFQQLFRFLKDVAAIRVQNDAVCRMQKKLIGGMFGADYDFYTKTQLGELGNAATTATFRAGLAVQYMVDHLSGLLIATVYFAAMIVISWKLTIISALIIVIIPLLTRKQGVAIRNRSKQVEEINSELHAYLIDKFRSIKKILLSNMGKKEMDYFSETARRREKTIVHTLTLISLIRSSLEPVLMGVVLAIIFFGVKIIKIDYSVLFLFLYILSRTKPAISAIVNSKNQVLIYMRSFDVVEDVFDRTQAATTITNGTLEFSGLDDSIRFEGVRFAYDDGEVLFDDFSIRLKANHTTALVGKSGSGKTTLLDLILRFRDIQKGRILLDNVDLKDIRRESFLKRIGMLAQDIVLFHGTILSNITYGLEDLTDQQIRQACQMAHVDDFVEELRGGYDAFIGESGAKLSGGQRQRLGLAHIFLKNPDIIILDEPTSALDGESERIIKNAVDTLKGKKTIIIVAHRLSTIKEADEIVVLEKGAVVAQGTFDELIEGCPEFRRMVELQQV